MIKQSPGNREPRYVTDLSKSSRWARLQRTRSKMHRNEVRVTAERWELRARQGAGGLKRSSAGLYPSGEHFHANAVVLCTSFVPEVVLLRFLFWLQNE